MEEQLLLDLTPLGSPAGLPRLAAFPGVIELQEAPVSRLCPVHSEGCSSLGRSGSGLLEKGM